MKKKCTFAVEFVKIFIMMLVSENFHVLKIHSKINIMFAAMRTYLFECKVVEDFRNEYLVRGFVYKKYKKQ